MSDARNDRTEGNQGWPWAIPDLQPALRMQLEVLLREQCDFLDRMQTLLAGWTKRRCEGMAAASRTFQRLQTSQGGGDVAAAYGEWLTDHMSRIIADMAEARDEAFRLAAIGPKLVTALSSHGANGMASCAGKAVPATNAPSPRGGKNAVTGKPGHDASRQR